MIHETAVNYSSVMDEQEILRYTNLHMFFLLLHNYVKMHNIDVMDREMLREILSRNVLSYQFIIL